MIIKINQVKELGNDSRYSRIGFAAGSFDLLHGGHLDYLKWANEHCDKLFVYIRCDSRIEEVKKRKPLVPETDRARIVDHLRPVSFTYIGTDFLNKPKPSVEVAKLLKPDVVLIGNGWANEFPVWSDALPEAKIIIYDKPQRDSTTRIINQIKLLKSSKDL